MSILFLYVIPFFIGLVGYFWGFSILDNTLETVVFILSLNIASLFVRFAVDRKFRRNIFVFMG